MDEDWIWGGVGVGQRGPRFARMEFQCEDEDVPKQSAFIGKAKTMKNMTLFGLALFLNLVE